MSQSVWTPSIVFASFLVFGMFAYATYRKYTKKNRARRYKAMQEDEVRMSMHSTPHGDAHTFFLTQASFVDEKSHLLP